MQVALCTVCTTSLDSNLACPRWCRYPLDEPWRSAQNPAECDACKTCGLPPIPNQRVTPPADRRKHSRLKLSQEGSINTMGFSTPIYINVYNSFHLLVRMVQALIRKGYHRIVILDNNSSYPSLLGYYRALPTPVRLIRLKTNMGHLAMWKSGLHHQHKNEWFALTDPDINLAPLPPDFVAHLIALHGLAALGPAVSYPVPNARKMCRAKRNPIEPKSCLA